MSVDNEIVNQSGNPPFSKILETRVSRRKILSGSLALAASSFFAPGILASAAAQAATDSSKPLKNKLMNFKPVAVADGSGPWPAISEDYQWQALLPWGEPIQPDGPTFSWPPTAANQQQQVGIGHDGMTFFPIQGASESEANSHGLLAINHEFGRNTHVLGKADPESKGDVLTSQYAHGVSIIEIKKEEEAWQRVKSDKNRRIHVNTPVTFSGPVAGHPLLKTPAGNPPAGTVNNCANGQTPWGTYLTCEENFNGYFGATGEWKATSAQARYGFSDKGFKYGWEKFDPRFDLSNAAHFNEENRFGWIVEIDPNDPKSAPVKRTALGRIKHEGVALVVARSGHVVAYMGDDQRFDYIYKYVSADDWQQMAKAGKSPLDEGRLYVAKFNDDGSGEWLELTIKNPVLAQHFNDQAEVLTYARLAADRLGATPMDRPEWTTVAPNGDVYCTLTNNSKRKDANAANPLAPNADGHIIKWRDSDNRLGTQFTWEIFLIAQDTHGTENTFSDPDGIWADPDGRLFIQTDGGQKDGLNNQLLVADTTTGELRRLFTGVTGDEITGITTTPDRRTLFINTQHPGNGDPAKTNFPAQPDGKTIPRDATIVITRKDGGIVGS